MVPNGGAPEYAPPAVIASDAPQEAATAPDDTAPDGPWWVAIGGPELDAFVAVLTAQNLDRNAALDRIKQADAIVRQATARRLPQVAGDAGVNDSRVITPSGEAVWNDTYTLGASASWDTDIFGGRRAAARSAQLSAEAARLSAHALNQSLIAALATSYVDAWALERQIDIARALAQSFDNTASLTDQRYRDGSQTASALNVLIARQNAAAARAATPELQALLTVRLNAIDLLLGRRPGETRPQLSVSPAAGAGSSPPQPTPADLFRNRPDVAAADLAYRAALFDVGVADAARWPSLTLAGVASRQTDDVSDLFDLDGFVATLTAGVVAPLFQGGRLKAEVDRAEARARELANTFGQSALTALADVNRAQALLEAYRQEVVLRAQSRDAAALSDQLALERYAAGQLSILSVLETRRALDAAERDLLNAQQNALQAVIDYALATGGAWGAPHSVDLTPAPEGSAP